MDGYVYAIKSGNLVKIGYSADPAMRFVKVKSDNADAVLLGAARGSLEHEAAIHEILAKHRVSGEWFRYEGHVVTFCSMLPAVKKVERSISDHPLAAYRRDNGLTQERLAEKVGVSRWTIVRIEADARHPSADLLRQFAEMGIDPLALLKRRAA
jgi:DNA-binding XRE family transcriptional regulator